ncbi:hypothetical protein KCU88_g283, partial [Aureobasidium melanogenum]
MTKVLNYLQRPFELPNSVAGSPGMIISKNSVVDMDADDLPNDDIDGAHGRIPRTFDQGNCWAVLLTASRKSQVASCQQKTPVASTLRTVSLRSEGARLGILVGLVLVPVVGGETVLIQPMGRGTTHA